MLSIIAIIISSILAIVFLLAMVAFVCELLYEIFNWYWCDSVYNFIEDLFENPVIGFLADIMSSSARHAHFSSLGAMKSRSGGSRGSSTGRRF